MRLNRDEMRVALLTLGTRGDVQPYAVLGRALKERGHEVILCTGKNFGGLAKEYGIEFSPVEADFQALINSPEGKEMMKNPFRARKHFATIVEPMMIDAMKDFYEIARQSDTVLYHVKSLADFFADQFPQKMIRANVIPAIQPTSEFPNPVFSGLSLPGIFNKLTYRLADLGLAMMKNAIKQFRVSARLDPNVSKQLDLPSIYGISPSFLKRPADFPADSYFTGFWQGSSPDALPSDVDQFISSGSKTVVVTFGSMPFETKFDLQQSLITMSRTLGVNILVVKGWGFENHAVLGGHQAIKLVQNAPFDKLFPKVDAVVHHGGIGTLAECLRAGVPSLSCPVIYPMGDQHFWGMQSYRRGWSVKPIALKRLNEEKLIASVSEMLRSSALRTNCKLISEKLRTENGVGTAVKIVESHFNSQKV